MKKNNFLLLSCLLLLFSAKSFAQDTQVMMQGFNWGSWSNTSTWYNVVGSKATDLKASGIDAIWLPPPSKTADNQGYIPTTWYDLNTKYGSQTQLVNLIQTLHNNNVKVLADIVINHRGGTTGWYDFSNPSWSTPTQTWSIVQGDECNCATGAADFNPQQFGLKSDPNAGGGYNAARDLDHTNVAVRQGIKDWMSWLKNTIGFDGWRYDFVHGYHGKYIKEYNQATGAYFSVGELLEGDRQRLSNWLDITKDGSADANSAVFDFATKKALQDAFNNNDLSYLRDNNGKASGLIGWWPAKSVTVLDNHDTGSAPNQNLWPFPGQHVEKGYAYLLTHPGIPMIFWDHFYDWETPLQTSIKKLIAIRKKNGLHSSSNLQIVNAQQNLYSAIIDNKVAMKLGSGIWSPTGADWVLAASGTDWAVWEKSAVTLPTTTFTVHFKKPVAWSSAKIHYWNQMPGNTATTWPGATMTTETNGWYAYTFSNISSANYLFNDNGSSTNKTVDLIRNTTGWYKDGVWYDTNPDLVNPPTTNTFTVYFNKPSSWSQVKIYYWNTSPAGSMPAVTWSGSATTQDGNWYKFTFTNTTSTSLIFNDGGTNKTLDLSRGITGYYYNGTWYDSDPLTNTSTGLKVHFYKPSVWAAAKIYYWNVSPAGCAPAATWPGVNMTSESNGWYNYTIGTCTSANIIFNSGAGQQTADLTRNTEGWYKDSSWSNGLPANKMNTQINNADNSEIFNAGPNPTNGYVKFSQEVVSVSLYSYDGKQYSVNLINGKEMDISKLPKGNYLLTAQSKDGKTIRTVLIKQ